MAKTMLQFANMQLCYQETYITDSISYFSCTMGRGKQQVNFIKKKKKKKATNIRIIRYQSKANLGDSASIVFRNLCMTGVG